MGVAATPLWVQVDDGYGTGVQKIIRAMMRKIRLGHPISRCLFLIGVQARQLDLTLIELTV